MPLRFLSSGESHGRGLLLILEGLPSHLEIKEERIAGELFRRRRGYGRGPRMKLERDRLTAWSGLRNGFTIGSPLSFSLENTEWDKWKSLLDPWKTDEEKASLKRVTRPRPGHADLPGAVKYGHDDIRNVLERASARSTAAWTVAGTITRLLLEELGVTIRSAVTSIGGVEVAPPESPSEWDHAAASDLGCPRREDEQRLMERIRKCGEEGDTLGGTFLLSAMGLLPGIGSHAEWDRRLDGRLAGAIMSIPAIKGVETGRGFELARIQGSVAHDEILPCGKGWQRLTNNAGGLEGGMTNGEELILSAAMKPIPTLKKPLRSIDINSGLEVEAAFERSDVCALPAACIVGEAMFSWVLAGAVMEQFGGDTLEDLRERWRSYEKRVGCFIHG